LTANILNTEQKIKNAITALNISTGIIGLLGALGVITYNLWLKFDWWNFIFPNPFYYEINDAFFNILPVDVVNYRFRARASSTFDNPLILATYLVTTTPFCAFGAVHFEHKKSRKISRYCLVGGLLGIVFTASRGAYIAIALAILVLIISGKKIFKKLFPFIISLGIAIPIGLTIRYNTTKVSDFIESDSKRLSIWQSCIKMFQQHPIFGMGAGTENIHLELQNTYGIDRTHAHNLFLEMLVEGGIIGGIFVVAIIVILIKNITAIFRMKNSLYRKYAVLYTSSLLSFTVISMFEFTLQSAKELMILFILLGFIEATYRMVTDTIQLASDEVLTYEEIPDTETQEQIEEKTTANV
jgi:O-antigen ligase